VIRNESWSSPVGCTGDAPYLLAQAALTELAAWR